MTNTKHLTAFVLLLFSTVLSYAQAWEQTNIAFSGGRFDDIHFVNDSIAYACSGGGTIAKTTDGGENWTTLRQDVQQYYRAIDFIDRDRGFCSSLSGQLLTTADGGQTWTDISDRLPTGTHGMCGITHVGETVWAAGIFSGPATIIKSSDGGQTWSTSSLDSLAEGFAEIEFIDENRGYAAGTKGTGATLLYTQDGGSSWQEVFETQNAIEYVWKLFFIEERIFGSIESFGDATFMVRSLDAGQTWEKKLVSGEGLDIQGIGFVSRDTGWVVPRSSNGYITTDAGETWEVDSNAPSNINRMELRSDGVLFASGDIVFKYKPEVISSIQEPSIFKNSISLSSTLVSSNFQVELNISKSTNFRLDIISLSGKRIQEIGRGRLEEGIHSFDVTLPSDLATGQYLVTLRADNGFSAKRFMRVNQ